MEPTFSIQLRQSQADYLLSALSLLPPEKQSNVVHQDLVKRILTVKNSWEQHNKVKKTQKFQTLKSKFKPKEKK